MNEQELWNYFKQREISHKRTFDREFVWAWREDFEPVQKYFVGEWNLFHPGNSFRSRGFLFHIHAVMHDQYISLHWDCGNVARFFPLGLIHLFLDVLPYQFVEKILRKPVRDLYGYPPEAPL